jgi:hypothetical protein
LGRADPRGDLGEREAVQELQHHDPPLLCRQPVEAGAKRVSDLRAVFERRLDFDQTDHFAAPRKAPRAIGQPALGDGVEPGENGRRAGLEAFEAAGCLGEDDLRDLFGLVVVGSSTADVAEDLGIVAPERLL